MSEQTSSSDKVIAPPRDNTILHLSPVQEGDYPMLYDWFSDRSEAHLWTNVRRPMSLEEFVADAKRRMQHSLMMVVRETSSQTPVGFFQLYDMALGDGTAGFMVYMDRHRRSVGYGILAVIEFLSYAFRSYPLRRIYAETYEFNRRSTLLLLGSGFREEGCLRRHLWWEDRYWDLVKYALTREHFETLAQRLLGPWANGNEGDAPHGFTRGEAQRLLIALATLPFSSQSQAGREHDDDSGSVSDGDGPDEYSETASMGLSTPEDVDDLVHLVHSNRGELGVEYGWPRLGDWTREQCREFLAPSGHLVYGYRDADGKLLAALVCRDEKYQGEPAVRIWFWTIEPNLDPEKRERAAMLPYIACAEDALRRGKLKSFVYARTGSAHASFVPRLLDSPPQPCPWPGLLIVVSDLHKTVQRIKALLAEKA
ncbi:MAG: GNAT family protein [Bacillota bacterium]|nr:GNAT family protein [Bacillota bacterium]